MIRLDSRVRDRVRLLACGATALFAISYAAGVGQAYKPQLAL